MGFSSLILFVVLSIIFLFQSLLLLHLPFVAANDVLTPGDQISTLEDGSSSTLLSSNGVFTMGFFTIPFANLTYLGIWYTNEQESNRVWIANRDQPIHGDAILMIDDLGILRVMNRSGDTVFNVSDDIVGYSRNNTRAMLQDTGNFVFYDIVTNRTIWQSFDHPTDTLIPGMKLGYNISTKENWELTSSANTDVPTSGAFTLRLENYRNSPQLLIYRTGVIYWTSGPWNKQNSNFEFLTHLDSKFDLIFDTSGMYLTVQAFGYRAISTATLQLFPNGRFTDKTIYPDKGTLNFCFGYEYEIYGCQIYAYPGCRPAFEGGAGGYSWGNQNYLLYGPNTTADNSSLGDCMERCWNDCDCVACSSFNDTGCIYWTQQNSHGSIGPILDKLVVYTLSQESGGPISAEDANSSPQPYGVLGSFKSPKKKFSRWILFSLAIVPVLVLAYVMTKRRIIEGKKIRRRDDLIHQFTGSNSFNCGDELERGIKDAPDVKIFNLKAILAAINNFSDENKLGQGGYGPVYKGELSDGRKIAVKRLSKTSGQGILEFKSELILISKLQHTNLVRLYGCCIHPEEKILIYEFMPNKSLDFFLFDDDKKKKLDWRIRFKIIEGIAQGLLYLHKYSRMRVIHRDLKASNVLLDENMNPKIADFGMARIFQKDVVEAVTKKVAGTYGYMAPEYVMHGTFSIKSDVFSFGVLILEIVSGKKNSSLHSILRYAWELWERKALVELKDERLGESFDVDQLLRTIHIGLLCVQEYANDRPIVSKVISMLNNEIADLPIPKKPLYFLHPNEVQPSRSIEHSLGNNIQGSLNRLTITTMKAR